MRTVEEWDEFVAKEREKLESSYAMVQEYVTEAGIPLEKLNELAKIDLSMVEPELLQEIEAVGGFKLAQLQSEKPVKDATAYRQRRNVIPV